MGGSLKKNLFGKTFSLIFPKPGPARSVSGMIKNNVINAPQNFSGHGSGWSRKPFEINRPKVGADRF